MWGLRAAYADTASSVDHLLHVRYGCELRELVLGGSCGPSTTAPQSLFFFCVCV